MRSQNIDRYTFKLHNLLGQVVFNEVSTINAGENAHRFDFTALPRGLYLLTVESNHGETITFKVNLQ
jgi:hypothetical protein